MRATLTSKILRIRNRLRTSPRTPRTSINTLRPVPANRGIKRQHMIGKVRIHVTARVCPERRRRPPGRRVRSSGSNICRYRCPREAPHPDPRGVPQMRVHAPSKHIKPVPKRARVRVEECAPVVVRAAALACGADDRCGERLVSRGWGRGGGVLQRAAPGGMQGVLVRGLVVDALEDVDFAAGGPVGADGPPGGPDTAAVRHGPEVGDE